MHYCNSAHKPATAVYVCVCLCVCYIHALPYIILLYRHGIIKLVTSHDQHSRTIDIIIILHYKGTFHQTNINSKRKMTKKSIND